MSIDGEQLLGASPKTVLLGALALKIQPREDWLVADAVLWLMMALASVTVPMSVVALPSPAHRGPRPCAGRAQTQVPHSIRSELKANQARSGKRLTGTMRRRKRDGLARAAGFATFLHSRPRSSEDRASVS